MFYFVKPLEKSLPEGVTEGTLFTRNKKKQNLKNENGIL